jgi:hypothetical protein
MQDPQIEEKHKTPTGLFTNWKAEETTSTFDDEWICAGTST